MTYKQVKQHILNSINTTYNNGSDIYNHIHDGIVEPYHTKAVRKTIIVWKDPKTQTEINKFWSNMEQKGLDIDFEDDNQRWKDRKQVFKENKKKAATFLLCYCNKMMDQRIIIIPNYEAQVKNDPIKMLKEINMKMYDPIDNKYDFNTLTKVLCLFLECKQFEDENLLDYTKRFKEAVDNLINFLGESFLTEFLKTTKQFKECATDEEHKVLIKNGFKQWASYIYIRNANKLK